MQAVTGGAHVPRAVLATAAEFGDVPRSIAEYIWNGFEYKRDKTAPAVVTIRFGKGASGRFYEVEDFPNGAGMSLEGLQRFFTMHAPNENRLRGDAGRGRNGTGKAAAFGVGSELVVYSIKNGISNEFRLEKGRLIALESVYPCESLPLEHTVRDFPVPEGSPQNGTRIHVGGIGLQFDEDAVVKNLTRLFMRVLDHNELRWEKRPGRVTRIVRERPRTVLDRDYASPPEIASQVGKITLYLHATEYDLAKQESGIVVTSVGGAVLEASYMNVTRRRSVVDKRVFGEVDVPELDLPDSAGRLATTQARRLQMNRESERVEALLPWLDVCLEDFKDAVEEQLSSTIDERDRAVLAAISGTLEHVLNEQYQRFMRDYSARMKLAKVNPLAPFPGAGEPGGAAPASDGQGESVFVPDPVGEAKAVADEGGTIQLAGPHGNEGTGGTAEGQGHTVLSRLDESGEPVSEKKRGQKRGRGGQSLNIVYRPLGATSPRSFWGGEGTFTINLDHPDFGGLQPNDDQFIRRSAEACAVVYSEAVLEMRVDSGDPTVSNPKDALNALLEQHDRVLRPLIEACPDYFPPEEDRE